MFGDQGQPETHAGAGAPAIGRAGAVEAFEDADAVLVGDPFAVVVDIDAHRVGITVEEHLGRAVAVLRRVGQQVGDDPGDPTLVERRDDVAEVLGRDRRRDPMHDRHR